MLEEIQDDFKSIWNMVNVNALLWHIANLLCDLKLILVDLAVKNRLILININLVCEKT
jgi:hypothetical protein